MGRYAKPSGYRSLSQPIGYKVFNNYISGDQYYSPSAPSKYSISYNFVGAPANGSQIQVQDGPTLKTFTYTYSGSPGAGIIPLVAGGGTAAQAATAAQVAMAAQLTYWTVTNPSSAALTMVNNLRGQNVAPVRVGTTNMSPVGGASPTWSAVLPARVGQMLGILGS
jgi:hypothetical protein